MLLIAVGTLPVFLLGAGAITIGKDVGFRAGGLGYLTAAFFLTAGVVSFPIGRLVERIGWRTAMRINVIGTGVLLLAMSVAIRNLASLAVLLMVAAFFYGFGNPAANTALAEIVSRERQGVVFGLKHAGIPTSTLLAGLAVPLIIVNAGWRWSFAAGAVVAAGVYLLIPPDAPGPGDATTSPRETRALLDPASLRRLAIGGVFATVAPSMLGTFTVTAAVASGLSEATAGVLLSVGGLVTIMARIVNGLLADAFGWRGFGAMAVLMAAGAVAALFLSVAAGLGFTIAALVAFATGWGWPGLMTYSVVRANAGSVASSSAIAQAGVFVGAGLAPVLIGLLSEQVSFRAAWLLVAGALSVAALTIGGLARRVEKVPQAG